MLDTLLYALVFILGLLARLLALVLVIAAFAVPIYLAVRGVGALEDAHHRRLGVVDDAGLPIALARRYTPTHTWLSKGFLGRVKVGLDGLGEWLLPAISSVELPEPGRHLAKGEPAVTIRSDGRVVTLPSPVDGTVTSTNPLVAFDPAVVHEDPYDRGWLFRVRPDSKEPPATVSGEVAREWFRKERHRLRTLLEPELGLAAADGGELILPPTPALDETRWRAVVDAFLVNPS